MRPNRIANLDAAADALDNSKAPSIFSSSGKKILYVCTYILAINFFQQLTKF